MRARMDGLADTLGAETRELPFPLDDFAHLQETLCYWEAARILLLPGRMRLAEGLTRLLTPYVAMDVSEYAAARQRRAAYQAQFAELAAPFDAILCPAALGVAPLGLQQTGDALMSRLWTILHVPNITVPMWRSSAGLPLAPQLIGKLGEDRALLQVAQWLLNQRS